MFEEVLSKWCMMRCVCRESRLYSAKVSRGMSEIVGESLVIRLKRK
jgi:hypothetical protein